MKSSIRLIRILVIAGLASVAASGSAVANSFFGTFIGAPASIACTNTDVTLAPGLAYSFSLPPAGSNVVVSLSAGAYSSSTEVALPLASGTLPLQGIASFPSTTFPYTFSYSITPKAPGGTTSSFSFLCAGATGTNFTIANGAPFDVGIPALGWPAMLALAGLLAALSLFALRRKA